MKRCLIAAIVGLMVTPGVASAQMMGGDKSGNDMSQSMARHEMQPQMRGSGMMAQDTEKSCGCMMKGERMGSMMSPMMDGMMSGQNRGSMMMAGGMMNGQVDLDRMHAAASSGNDTEGRCTSGRVRASTASLVGLLWRTGPAGRSFGRSGFAGRNGTKEENADDQTDVAPL